jgi:hypothetical protein
VVTLDFGENVHIIPLGFEIDRAVKPFERFKANRVYILTTTDPKYPQEMNKKQEYFIAAVKNRLEEKAIEVIVKKDVDIFKMLPVMKSVSELVLDEKGKGNDVYVNMSAAGRLTSLGASLAAMAHNAKVYYVHADRYSSTPEEESQHGLSICDKLDPELLENFQIKFPDRMGRIVLVKLCKQGKKMRTDEILKLLIAKGIELFVDVDKQNLSIRGAMEKKRRDQQKNLVNLNKAILSKLEKNGYITREKLGRLNYIDITESGKYIAHILGLKE